MSDPYWYLNVLKRERRRLAKQGRLLRPADFRKYRNLANRRRKKEKDNEKRRSGWGEPYRF